MTAGKSEKEAAGQLLDALYLDMFHLIEEHTQCRVNLERSNASGAILLARTRFQHGGSNSVSTAQIPTENSSEFNALCRIVDSADGNGISVQRQAVDKNNGFVEPLNWFSVLPPMSLRNAATKFKDCIELVAESTNLQRQLGEVLGWIAKLRQSPVLQ
ncbi:uncharacterized protein Dana_GF11637 [Drosophila ananassae]|uniref:Vacuolar ATPase assembly protein VMA22 n=1 Tax=Drosophila ananassae TaxID=7217 RepID=B3MX59_DROAN|nr:uncharacterized protein LOC6494501 [Drosophila ananassae]EDV35282.1 uncharacterized protein Dana_GF11637 [Drosophila ananassae]